MPVVAVVDRRKQRASGSSASRRSASGSSASGSSASRRSASGSSASGSSASGSSASGGSASGSSARRSASFFTHTLSDGLKNLMLIVKPKREINQGGSVSSVADSLAVFLEGLSREVGLESKNNQGGSASSKTESLSGCLKELSRIVLESNNNQWVDQKEDLKISLNPAEAPILTENLLVEILEFWDSERNHTYVELMKAAEIFASQYSGIASSELLTAQLFLKVSAKSFNYLKMNEKKDEKEFEVKIGSTVQGQKKPTLSKIDQESIFRDSNFRNWEEVDSEVEKLKNDLLFGFNPFQVLMSVLELSQKASWNEGADTIVTRLTLIFYKYANESDEIFPQLSNLRKEMEEVIFAEIPIGMASLVAAHFCSAIRYLERSLKADEDK